jgi:hypothetical protein
MGHCGESCSTSYRCSVLMVEFWKRNIRAKRTILDAVKDHVIPHVSGKEFSFQMW